MAVHVVLYLKRRIQKKQTACKFKAELGNVWRAFIVAEEIAAQQVTHPGTSNIEEGLLTHVTNAS
jgi:hypothetical protein